MLYAPLRNVGFCDADYHQTRRRLLFLFGNIDVVPTCSSVFWVGGYVIHMSDLI